MFSKNCLNCQDTKKFLRAPQISIFGDVIYYVSIILMSLFLLFSTVSSIGLDISFAALH